MVGTKTLICGAWLCGVYVYTAMAPAEADAQSVAPRSLRMRPGAAASPHHASKRVGQAPPDQPADAAAAADSPDAASAPDAAGAPDAPGASDAPGAADTADVAAPGVVPPAAPAPVAARPMAAAAVPGAPPDVGSEDPAERAARRNAPALFTVTGSLIERATRTTPSPLTILDRRDLLAAGRSMIGDILQPLPEQGNALNAQFNNGGDGSTRINLRGLGIARTLTLLNGRRFVPGGTGADTSVDLNTIPLAMIDRVEILKDGGSSVYGSDAIAGVVNVITRDNFRGTEASLYTAQTEHKDGFTFDASFITGHRTEDGKGNIVFSAGTQQQDPVFAGDREFSKVTKTFDFTSGTTTNSGSTSTPSGRIDATQIDLNGDGRGDPFNLCGAGVRFCTNDGRGGYRPFISPNDLYNFQPINYLYTPSERVNAYTAGNYTIAPHVKGFFEASFLHRTSDQQLASEPLVTSLFGASISRDSIYNPFGGDVLSYNRRLEELGPRRFLQSADTMRAVVGMRGEGASPDSWKWELSYNYGRTDATQKTEGQVVLSHLLNAIGPSFLSPFGGPTCGTPFAPISGCVPANILGPSGSISPAARNYLTFTGMDSGSDQQQTALATAHGRIVRLPNHGDISAAVSADVRRDTGDFTPDALITSGDTTANMVPAVHGSTQALEAAAELQIVPIRDRDGVERLEVDLATRAFRYDSFGSGVTSSVRALARPFRGLTLRASRSSSFRAPSISELFQANSDSFPIATDPCDHAFGVARVGSASPTSDECAREGVPGNAVFGTFQQRAVLGGNAKLNPETAKVVTAGIVLESPLPRGLSLSIDVWSIDLTQAIQQPLIQNVFANCYQNNIRSFCDLVHRDPMTHAIDFVDLTFSNFGGTATSGVDTAVSFDHHAPGLGDLHARLDVQTLRAFDVDTGNNTVLHGLGNYDLGAYPKRKASLLAVWQHPHGASAGFNFHFVDSFQECENNDCNDGNLSRTVDSYSKLDVFSTVTFKRGTGETTLTVGVNNVFDRAPPAIYNGAAGNYDEATYDFLGRFFYARLTQSL
jgi:iron complex outermembrane recepter protein